MSTINKANRILEVADAVAKAIVANIPVRIMISKSWIQEIRVRQFCILVLRRHRKKSQPACHSAPTISRNNQFPCTTVPGTRNHSCLQSTNFRFNSTATHSCKNHHTYPVPSTLFNLFSKAQQKHISTPWSQQDHSQRTTHFEQPFGRWPNSSLAPHYAIRWHIWDMRWSR